MKKRSEAWTLCCIQPCLCGKQWPMHLSVCMLVHCSECCHWTFIAISTPLSVRSPLSADQDGFLLFLCLCWWRSEEIDQKLLKYTMHIIENVRVFCGMWMDGMWCWTWGDLSVGSSLHLLMCLVWSRAQLLYQMCQMYLCLSCQLCGLCSALYVVQSSDICMHSKVLLVVLQLRIHWPIRCF